MSTHVERAFNSGNTRRRPCGCYFGLVLIVLAMLTSFPQRATSQYWTKLNLPQGYASAYGFYLVPYFLNSSYGFIHSYGFQLPDYDPDIPASLARTTDGGQSFVPLRFFESAGLVIMQLKFLSL